MSDCLDVEAWIAEARQAARRSAPCSGSQSRDDLAQETLVRALAHPPGRAGAGPGIGAWLERICRNLRVDDWRAATRARSAGDHLPAPPPATTAEESLLARERRREVRRALLGLPRPQRRALILRFFGGWSFDEIGARLGLPQVTARTRVHRALLALRVRMAALRAWIVPSLPGFKPALAALLVLAAQPRAPEPALRSSAVPAAEHGARSDQHTHGGRRSDATPERAAAPRLTRAGEQDGAPVVDSPPGASERVVSDGERRPHATRARPVAAAADRSSTGAVKRYDFDDDEVEGDFAIPGIEHVDATTAAAQPSLIELRPHFLPEVIKTLEDL